MKRPVLWLLGFLICGIVVGKFGSLAFLGITALAAVFTCAVLFRTYKYWPVFVFVPFLILGAWRVGHSLHSYATHTMYSVRLSGVARDVGITGGGNQRVIVRMENGIQFMAYIRPHLAWASLGQEITVTGDLQPLSTPQNPGGYNQFQHLRSQKVDATIWAETVTLGEVRMSLPVALRMMRDRLAAVYDQLLPPREAAIMRSMVLGDRHDLDRELADQYRNMGIFHLLSISGLHVGILMMALNTLLGKFLSPRKTGIIVLVIMVLYCLMTGASTATVRAVSMGGILIFGKILGRDYDLLASVSWAGVALLLYEPLFLFNMGFQLSFAAVFGIATITAPVERLLAQLRLPKWGKFRSGMAVNIAATVSTYPVFAFHLYEIQLYSVPGNIIVAPTTTIILVIGVVVGILGLVWTGGATLLAGTVYYILRFYEISSGFFTHLPHAMLLTGGGNLLVAGLGGAVLFAFMYAYNGFGQSFRRRVWLIPFAAAALVVAIFAWQNPRAVHVTELATWGNYSVVRHGGDVLVIGAPQGGESDVLRYLDMHRVQRANGLVMLEPPRPQDVGRLMRLAERVEVFYISENTTGYVRGRTEDVLARIEAALYELGMPMPQIVWLDVGSIRVAGRKEMRVIETEWNGRMEVEIR